MPALPFISILRKLPRALWWKVALAWTILLLLLGLYWAQLAHTHHQQLAEVQDEARLRARQTAQALTYQTESLLRNLNFIVLHLGEHWRGPQDEADMRHVVALALEALPQGAILEIVVANAQGEQVFSNLYPPGKAWGAATWAGRSTFDAHVHDLAQGKPPQLHLSQSGRYRIQGQPVVQLSRPVVREGRLQSVVIASVSTQHLAQAFQQVYPDPQDVVMLVTNQGHYVARTQGLEDALVADVPPDPRERQFLQSQPQLTTGQYEATARLDGIERYYAWERLPSYPLVLGLGLGKAKVLARVHEALRISHQRNLLATILLMLAAGSITRLLITRSLQRQRLQEAAELRAALMEHNPAIILLVTPQRRIHHANARARAVFGTPKQPLVGQPAANLHVDPSNVQVMDEHYQNLYTEGYTQLIHPLRTAQGTIRWYEMQAVLSHPGNPQRSDSIWTLIDITDNHLAHQAIQVQHLRLMLLLEHFPAGVLLEDAEQRIVMANQALCDLLQLPSAPADLTELPRSALLAQLDAPRAAWFEPPNPDTERRSSYEVEDLQRGLTLEVAWLPICQDGQNQGQMWLLRDITQRKQHEKKLATLASTDTLTGLPNRRSFMAAFEQLLHTPDPHPSARPLGAVLMLDIDHFKQVNDTWGHPVGDLVLQQVARVLRQTLRQDDLPARLGGEEFAILVRHTALPQVLELAERVRHSIAAQPTPVGPEVAAENDVIPITISIGVAPLSSAQDATTALAQADKALYQAKTTGRNRVCLANL